MSEDAISVLFLKRKLMPQPYLPTFVSKRYFIGVGALNERPTLMCAIAKCIGLWSYVDNELQGLFGILVGSDSAAALSIFTVLRKWSHQREALDSAAKTRLSGVELDVYHSLTE